MKLEKYMKSRKISDDQMAALLGKERSVVNRYRRGKIIPPPEIILKIQIITNRAVKLNDWFESEAA